MKHIGSVGLVLDMIGVSILFFVVVTIGEQVNLIDPEENKARLKKKKRKEFWLRIGYGLIVLGFILQLISNEKNIS